jgi:acetylornithine deacetylase/succinyl-diaminopimelate desuccinylase-like protein
VNIDAVLARIDRDEVIELALALGNIDSPRGHEGPVADFLCDWYERHGFTPRRLALVPDRPNVVAVLPGSGGGHSLLFNAHMDTGTRHDDDLILREPGRPDLHSAWLDGDEIVGDGVVNDKGPMAAFLVAAKAIRDAGVPLRGDLVLTSVAGEIGQEPVDEWQGLDYVSKEVGARFMVNHGVVADYAVVAEGTGFGITWVEAGKAHFRITVSGGPTYYTPYLPDRTTPAESPNAIVAATRFIEAFETWAAEYQERWRRETPGGVVLPKASINAMRAGVPTRVTQSPQLCRLYADVRLVPDQDVLAVRAELRALLSAVGLDGDVELYAFRRGYEATNVERLVDTVRRCHRDQFGAEPPDAVSPAVTSMWRDTNVFAELGIPAVCYAPRSSAHATRKSMKAEWLYEAAQVYARIALDLCNQPKAEPGGDGTA